MTEQEPMNAEPVSWLRLERYHLGELTPEEARAVEEAVARNPATLACLEQIRRPVVGLRPRPELPVRRENTARAHGRLRLVSGSPRALAALATFAAAALLVLFVVSRGDPAGGEGVPPARLRVKGGEVALELVRDRRGAITERPGSFTDGDRFKVRLTCPPSLDGAFDVVVLQGKDAFFPLDAPAAVACGNLVPLPLAFTLDGTRPTTVCVTWGAQPNARTELTKTGVAALTPSNVLGSVCTSLAVER